MSQNDFVRPENGRYSCLTLGNALVACDLPNCLKLDERLWARRSNPFSIGERLERELGEFLTEAVSKAGLVIVATADSIDAVEDERLRRLTWRVFQVLQLFGVSRSDRVFQFEGSLTRDGATSVLAWRELMPFRRHKDSHFNPFKETELRASPQLARGRELLTYDTSRRLYLGIEIFFEALRNHYREDRLHQFVRSLDAIMKTEQGKGRQQFIDRCSFLLSNGAACVDTLDDAYRLRSTCEHLGDPNTALSGHTQAEKDTLYARRTFEMELVASYAWRRVLGDNRLIGQFSCDADIDAFWNMSAQDRSALWGAPFDLASAMQERYRPG